MGFMSSAKGLFTGIIDALGEAARQSAQRGEALRAAKSAVLTVADSNLVLLNELHQLFLAEREVGYRGIFWALDQALRRPSNPLDRRLAELYERVYAPQLTGRFAVLERRRRFAAIEEAVTLMLADHALVRQHFQALFAQNGAYLSEQDIKISHAIVLGYLEACRVALDWIVFLIQNVALPDTVRPLKYQLDFLEHHAEFTGVFADELGARRFGATILTQVEDLKRRGVDVYLVAGGQVVSAYASDSDYTRGDRLALSRWLSVRNWIVAFADGFLVLQRNRYERNKELAETLKQKVALLTLQLQNVDPKSPDYQKQLQVITNYQAIIAQLDKRIAEYENK